MKKGWTTSRLGDVAKTQYGLSELMNEEGKGFKIFRMGDVQDGRLIDTGRMKYADISTEEFGKYKLRKGDVLFNRTNSFELVGKTGIFTLDGDYCFASYLVRLNLDRRIVLPEFLNYFMNSGPFQQSVKGKASKSINQANINATILSNEHISYPPLAEQQRIVGVLDEAFAGLATAQANAAKNLQNARALFESHIQSVFTQRGKGWVETTLGEITGGVFTGPFGSLLHKRDYIENGIPLVNPAHITDTGIEPDYSKTVSAETAKRLANYVMHNGDIVIGRRGEMGRCAVVTDVEDGWLCGTGSFYIKLSERCDSHFLVRLLRSAPCRASLEKLAGGAVMPNLSNTVLAGLAINLPPLAQQRTMVKELDALAAETQRLTRLYEQKQAALSALKKSLLHQAFTGNL